MSRKVEEIRDSIIEQAIFIEGGYVDDPYDSGGKTKYGITEETARLHGFKKDVKALTKDEARQIYVRKYWDKLKLDSVVEYSTESAEILFISAIHCGTIRAAKFFQRALNVLNNREIYYKDIVADGHVGSKTITAFSAFSNYRSIEGGKVLHQIIVSLYGAFLIELAERREKDERFIYGWFLNRFK
jgi:lysozyme family protein